MYTKTWSSNLGNNDVYTTTSGWRRSTTKDRGTCLPLAWPLIFGRNLQLTDITSLTPGELSWQVTRGHWDNANFTVKGDCHQSDMDGVTLSPTIGSCRFWQAIGLTEKAGDKLEKTILSFIKSAYSKRFERNCRHSSYENILIQFKLPEITIVKFRSYGHDTGQGKQVCWADSWLHDMTSVLAGISV